METNDYAVAAQLLAVQPDNTDAGRTELLLQVGSVRLRAIHEDGASGELPPPGSRVRIVLRPGLSFFTRPKKANKKLAAHGPTLHAVSVQGVVLENDGQENLVIDAGLPLIAHVADKELLARANPGSWVQFESDPPTRVQLVR